MQSNSFPAGRSQPKRLWVIWLLFFFQFAGIGVYFTFLNIYYRLAGLSGTQIGVINMTTALITVGSAVIWGYISDRTGQSRVIMAVGAVGTLVVTQFVPLVSGFSAFLALAAAGSFLSSAPATLVDSTVMVLLGDRREDYGRYRLGGSIGFIITALSVGFIFERFGLKLMFPAYGIVMACFAATALLLPAIPVRLGERVRGGLSQMVRRPAWILFTLCVFLCWIATNASIMFLGVSLQAMGASQSLIGIASTIGAVVELPFMLYSGRFLRRFGPVRLLLVAMSIMVVRFFLLGLMPAPEWAIAINMLNGPAFVFFWNSAVTYTNRMAPPQMAGTAQGMLNSTMSLAGVVSSLLTGWLFDLLGPNRLFLVMAAIVLAALALFGAGSLLRRQARLSADRQNV